MARKPKPTGRKESFGSPKQIADLQRSVNKRSYQNKIIIVVEGKKTEKQYFTNLKISFHKLTLHVEVHPGIGKYDALSLVKYASELKKKDLNNNVWDEQIDQIWVVCDTEGVQNVRKIQSAKMLASRNGIKLALSNPCFEYWGILHYQKTFRPFQTPEKVKQYLREAYIPGYEESMDLFALTKDRINFALGNVNELRNENNDHWRKNCNPSTDVDGLITNLL